MHCAVMIYTSYGHDESYLPSHASHIQTLPSGIHADCLQVMMMYWKAISKTAIIMLSSLPLKISFAKSLHPVID